MGGDGGTLNNSRHEHTRLRRAVLRPGSPSAAAAAARLRASTTHCALSHAPLAPPHVVADRLGNLYNKAAVLAHLLSRPRPDPLLPHVRSLARDLAPARLSFGGGGEGDGEEEAASDGGERGGGGGGGQCRRFFVCPVSRKPIVPDANCSIGWRCGCVTAAVPPDLRRALARADTATRSGARDRGDRGDQGDGGGDQDAAVDDEETQYASEACLNCGRFGPRVPLGQTREQRDATQRLLLQQRHDRRRARKAARKRARAESPPPLQQPRPPPPLPVPVGAAVPVAASAAAAAAADRKAEGAGGAERTDASPNAARPPREREGSPLSRERPRRKARRFSDAPPEAVSIAATERPRSSPPVGDS